MSCPLSCFFYFSMQPHQNYWRKMKLKQRHKKKKINQKHCVICEHSVEHSVDFMPMNLKLIQQAESTVTETNQKIKDEGLPDDGVEDSAEVVIIFTTDCASSQPLLSGLLKLCLSLWFWRWQTSFFVFSFVPTIPFSLVASVYVVLPDFTNKIN